MKIDYTAYDYIREYIYDNDRNNYSGGWLENFSRGGFLELPHSPPFSARRRWAEGIQNEKERTMR